MSARDLQIPKPPIVSDKATQNWFNAVGAILGKYIFGKSGVRLVSVQDLVNLGIADSTQDAQLIAAKGNKTVPPKVSNLTAEGALASIILTWTSPSISNLAYVEIWRSDTDDFGTAFLIARSQVSSYVDGVGSGATKYYWARAVTTASVKSELTDSVKGVTGYDPEYVKTILTAAKWQASRTVMPYQYIQPTTPNGYQYACIDGGVTGTVEPTWSTTVGATINDGSAQWYCVAQGERVPFIIGDIGGVPAVFIDVAFIKDASISSAKIGNLVADKITTGDLTANIQVLSKLWCGFSDFVNAGNLAGFWIGMNGSQPALHMNTGASHGGKFIKFTGDQLQLNVDLLSSSDATFDNMHATSLGANRLAASYGLIETPVVASTAAPDFDDLSFVNFLRYKGTMRGTVTLTHAAGSNISEVYTGNGTIGTGYGYSFTVVRTPANKKIAHYSKSDPNSLVRFQDQNITAIIKLSGLYTGFDRITTFVIQDENGTIIFRYDDSDLTPSDWYSCYGSDNATFGTHYHDNINESYLDSITRNDTNILMKVTFPWFWYNDNNNGIVVRMMYKRQPVLGPGHDYGVDPAFTLSLQLESNEIIATPDPSALESALTL